MVYYCSQDNEKGLDINLKLKNYYSMRYWQLMNSCVTSSDEWTAVKVLRVIIIAILIAYDSISEF